MILKIKNSTKSLLLGLTLLSAIFPYNIARASILSDFDSGMADIRNFIQLSIQRIRSDFCSYYSLSVSSGLWSERDIRARIGKDICNNFKVLINDRPAYSAEGTYVNETLTIPSRDITATVPSVSEHLPSPLVGDVSAEGNKINNSEIIYWTNIERNKSNTGLRVLAENNVLDRIALIRVQDMFDKSYFAHVSPTGDSAIKEAIKNNYEYISIGENLALGNFSGSRDLVNAWMNSPGHRANILNQNYSEIGVAAVQGMYKGEQVWISAQIFGRPLSECVSPDEVLKDQISGDKVSAENLSNKLKSIQAELNAMAGSDSVTYNAKVAEYNATVKLYNNLVSEIKSLTSKYNQQVQIFNECIKSA